MQKVFRDLYKSNLDMQGTQEERRRSLLDKQKEERQKVHDQQRSLEEVFAKHAQKNNGKSKWQDKQQEWLLKSFKESYGVDLSLQQSEWLKEKPEEMDDWLLVPCPKGQHCLVVAHNRHTVVYNRIGNRVAVFRSMLPGDGIETEALTILDCIYVRGENAFYVLDVLAFGGQHNLIYCEAEFRFFWLQSKWDEYEFLEQRSEKNTKPFHLVKQYDMGNAAQIAECLQKFPLWTENKPELDGFLFYHRFASYTCGSTPLVGWLFAFMVPDILGFTISSEYIKPSDYSEPIKYMEDFDKRLNAKRQKKQERFERFNKKNENSIAPVSVVMENAIEDHDEEDSLKKLLEAQRELEMEQDVQTETDVIENNTKVQNEGSSFKKMLEAESGLKMEQDAEAELLKEAIENYTKDKSEENSLKKLLEAESSLEMEQDAQVESLLRATENETKDSVKENSLIEAKNGLEMEQIP